MEGATHCKHPNCDTLVLNSEFCSAHYQFSETGSDYGSGSDRASPNNTPSKTIQNIQRLLQTHQDYTREEVQHISTEELQAATMFELQLQIDQSLSSPTASTDLESTRRHMDRLKRQLNEKQESEQILLNQLSRAQEEAKFLRHELNQQHDGRLYIANSDTPADSTSGSPAKWLSEYDQLSLQAKEAQAQGLLRDEISKVRAELQAAILQEQHKAAQRQLSEAQAEEQLGWAQQELEVLRKQMANLQNDMVTQQHTLALATQDQEALRNQLNVALGDKDQLHRGLQQSERARSQLQQELTAVSTQNINIGAHRMELQQNVEQLQAQLVHLQDQFGSAANELATYSTTVESQKMQFQQSLATEKEKMEQERLIERDRHNEEMVRVRKAIQNDDVQRELSMQNEKLQRELWELKEELKSEKEQKIETAQSKEEEAAKIAEKQRLMEENAGLLDKLEKITTNNEETQKMSERNRRELEQALVTEWETMINKLKCENKELSTEIEKLTMAYDQLVTEKNNTEAQKEQLSKQLVEVNEKWTVDKQAMESKHELEIEKLNIQITGFIAEKDILSQRLQTATDELENMRNEVKKISTENVDVNSQVAAVKKIGDTMAHQIEEMSKEKMCLNQENKDLVQINNELRDNINKLIIEQTNVCTEKQKLQDQVEELDKKLQDEVDNRDNKQLLAAACADLKASHKQTESIQTVLTRKLQDYKAQLATNGTATINIMEDPELDKELMSLWGTLSEYARISRDGTVERVPLPMSTEQATIEVDGEMCLAPTATTITTIPSAASTQQADTTQLDDCVFQLLAKLNNGEVAEGGGISILEKLELVLRSSNRFDAADAVREWREKEKDLSASTMRAASVVSQQGSFLSITPPQTPRKFAPRTSPRSSPPIQGDWGRDSKSLRWRFGIQHPFPKRGDKNNLSVLLEEDADIAQINLVTWIKEHSPVAGSPYADGLIDRCEPLEEDIIPIHVYSSSDNITRQMQRVLTTHCGGGIRSSSPIPGGESIASDDLSQEWKYFITKLTTSLHTQVPPYCGDCYKYCNGKLKVGDIITWSNPTSGTASFNLLKCIVDASEERHILILRATKSARSIQPYSPYPIEEEVVVLPNATFKVCAPKPEDVHAIAVGFNMDLNTLISNYNVSLLVEINVETAADVLSILSEHDKTMVPRLCMQLQEHSQYTVTEVEEQLHCSLLNECITLEQWNLMLSAGGDPNKVNLMYIIVNGCQIDLIDVVLRDSNQCVDRSEVLKIASERGDAEMMKALLTHYGKIEGTWWLTEITYSKVAKVIQDWLQEKLESVNETDASDTQSTAATASGTVTSTTKPDPNALTALYLIQMGYVLGVQGDLLQAEETIKKGLELAGARKEQPPEEGEKDSSTNVMYTDIAELGLSWIRLQLGNYYTAVHSVNNAIVYINNNQDTPQIEVNATTTHNTNNIIMLQALLQSAKLYIILGLWDKATDVMDKAESIVATVPKGTLPYMTFSARLGVLQATLCFDMGDWCNAELYYFTSLNQLCSRPQSGTEGSMSVFSDGVGCIPTITTLRSKIWNSLARVAIVQGRYQRAAEHIQKAQMAAAGSADQNNNTEGGLPPSPSKTATQDNSSLVGLEELHLLYIQTNKHEQALQCACKIWEVMQAEWKTIHPNVEHAYVLLGACLKAMDQFPKALSAFQQAVKIRQELVGGEGNYPELADLYSEIGDCHAHSGDPDQALAWHLAVLEVRRQVYGESHKKIGDTYHGIAGIYKEKKEYKEALKWYSKGLGLRQSVFDSTAHLDIAESCKCMADIYKISSMHDTSLDFYGKAAGITRSVCRGGGSSAETTDENMLPHVYHPLLSLCYSCMGSVYTDMGKHEEALAAYQVSLDVQLKLSGGKSDVEIARKYTLIADACSAADKIDEALEYYNKAITIREEQEDVNKNELAGLYVKVGSFAVKHGKNETALNWYEKALQATKDIVGTDYHPNIANLWSNIGTVMNAINQNPSGPRLAYENSLTIKKQLYGELHPEVAECHRTLADFHHKRDNNTAATTHYNKAIDIYRQRNESADEKCAADLERGQQLCKQLVTVCEEMDDWNAVLQASYKSVEFIKLADGPSGLSIGQAFARIAGELSYKRHYEQAADAFEKSIQACSEVMGEDDSQIAALKAGLEACHDHMVRETADAEKDSQGDGQASSNTDSSKGQEDQQTTQTPTETTPRGSRSSSFKSPQTPSVPEDWKDLGEAF